MTTAYSKLPIKEALQLLSDDQSDNVVEVNIKLSEHVLAAGDYGTAVAILRYLNVYDDDQESIANLDSPEIFKKEMKESAVEKIENVRIHDQVTGREVDDIEGNSVLWYRFGCDGPYYHPLILSTNKIQFVLDKARIRWNFE